MGIGTGTAAVIGGVASAGAGIAGSAMKSSAAKSAADQQAAAAQQAQQLQAQAQANSLAFQQQVWNQQQGYQSPYLQAGQGALGNLSNMLSVGNNTAIPQFNQYGKQVNAPAAAPAAGTSQAMRAPVQSAGSAAPTPAAAPPSAGGNVKAPINVPGLSGIKEGQVVNAPNNGGMYVYHNGQLQYLSGPGAADAATKAFDAANPDLVKKTSGGWGNVFQLNPQQSQMLQQSVNTQNPTLASSLATQGAPGYAAAAPAASTAPLSQAAAAPQTSAAAANATQGSLLQPWTQSFQSPGDFKAQTNFQAPAAFNAQTNFNAPADFKGNTQFTAPDAFKAPTAAEAAATPGYQFAVQQGQQALERSAAASGNLLTGGTAKALENYAQGVASTNYQQTYNNAFSNYQNNYNNMYQNFADTYARQANQYQQNYTNNANTFQQGFQNQQGQYQQNYANAANTFQQNYGNQAQQYQQNYGNQFQNYQQNYNQFQQNQANQYARLSGLAGVGQGAANALTGAGSAAAAGINSTLLGGANSQAQSLNNAAAAQASGQVGSANAWGGGLSNIGNTAMGIGSLPYMAQRNAGNSVSNAVGNLSDYNINPYAGW